MRSSFRIFLLAVALPLGTAYAEPAAPALDALKTQAGNFDFLLPETARVANSPRLTPARAEWLKADIKYSDRNFTPKPQRRLSTEDSPMVMLQGFHWYADSQWNPTPNGWWGVVAAKAPEIGRAGFDLVWLPPVSTGTYYPTEWYNLSSNWGTKETLISAVNALHAADIKVLADVVLNHRNGTKNWADFTSPDWPTTVIVRDDEWTGGPKSRYYDEGQGERGCRDLDHRSELVQNDAKVFLRWLRNEIGFDGWRFDMVKGYPPAYTKIYNEASSPLFTVGEYYDSNRQLLADWIDGTDTSQGKKNASPAFDFTTRYALTAAVETDDYRGLNDNGRPSGLIGWWPAKSVTFVENHDTSPRDPTFLNSAPKAYRAQRLAAYAYILTHPGIPCVFWPHYFDWGQTYRNAVQELLDLRKTAGITSTSRMGVLEAAPGLYAAVIDGHSRRVVVRLGSNRTWDPGQGWTRSASGENYTVWTQPR